VRKYKLKAKRGPGRPKGAKNKKHKKRKGYDSRVRKSKERDVSELEL